jgi:WD40 repeat protein/serine/threonine protein kinase
MNDANPSAADPLGQIADEFVEALRQGQRPTVEEFARRYPAHAGDLREILPALALMEQAKSANDTPARPHPAPAAAPLRQLGDYEILREIGRGGMGVVYEAQQLSLGRHVAIKVLPPHALPDPRQLGRFRREARSAARLHHTNIVPVFGVGEQDGLHYYVMQFIPGLGLDLVLDELRRLRQPRGKQAPPVADVPAHTADSPRVASAANVAHGLLCGDFTLSEGHQSLDPESRPGAEAPRPPEASASVHLPGQSGGSTLSESGNQYWQSVARVGMQVADALAHAAGQGILHRDIKPSNLLLDDTGNVWVTDFGLAKADTDGDNLTHTGDVVGTLRYMAPERFNGQGDVRSEVYSLGLTLYELLALRPAFDEADRNKLVKQVLYDEPVRPRKLNRAVPRDLETVVLKAIARDPAHRYQSPTEMADDLKRFVEDRPVRARRIGAAEKLWRWCRRNPAVAGMAAAVVLAMAVGTAVSCLKYLDAEQQKGIALQQQARAEAGEKEATEQRSRADNQAEVAQQNLYYAQMHLAQKAWREHRGLPHLRALLANWIPRDDSPDRRGWEWFYVNSLPYQNLRTLTEPGDHSPASASVVAWHVATNRLAEGTSDGTIRIWDVDRERTTLVLRQPAPIERWQGARWLGWSPDGGKLAGGCGDGTVHLWDTVRGGELLILRGHKSPVHSVAFSSDGGRVAAWAMDGAIKIWEAITGRVTADLLHPGTGGVGTGAWSPDDKLLASGHGDGKVTISGTHPGDKKATLQVHSQAINSLAWSADSTRLASVSSDFTASVLDVASEKVVLGPLRHSHYICAVAWEPDGKRLATGSADQTVKIWDTATGREENTLRGHPRMIYSLAWSPSGRLASMCNFGSMRIWNSVGDQESSQLSGCSKRATSLSWSPDGRRLVSGGEDGKVRTWDATTREELRTIGPQFGPIRSLAWRPDGQQLTLAGGAVVDKVQVWNAATGREVLAIPIDLASIFSVAWSPDGTHLAAGLEDGTIRVIELVKDTPKVRVFKAHRGPVHSLAWSPKGDRLASGGGGFDWLGDNDIALWDPTSGTEEARLQAHKGPVLRVAWSPDGKRLASASPDSLVIAWDAETGRKLITMRGHNDWATGVAWSPDGTRLASAGLDNSVRIWDPRTGAEALVLQGDSTMFRDISWHPDGAQLAAAGEDGRIWVWDATRGFERDTTARALPYIDRKVASGTARGEDRRWYAQSYLRAGKLTQALAVVKNDRDSLRSVFAKLPTDKQEAFARLWADAATAASAANNAERIELAQIAYDLKEFTFAARLWAEALTTDPKLGDDRQTQHCYSAACAAALAAAGPRKDEAPLDEAVKMKQRQQALTWLKAELTVWGKLLESDPPLARPNIVRTLSHWQRDTDLASIRDTTALARLPAEQQQGFTQLWADVAALLKKAEENPK